MTISKIKRVIVPNTGTNRFPIKNKVLVLTTVIVGGLFMTLDKVMQSLKFDSRMIEFNLRTGVITKEELQKYLSQLPDSSNNSEKVNLEDNSDDSDLIERH